MGTTLSVKGGWLRWRSDAAYSTEGAIRISEITSVYHGDGDSYICVTTSGANFYNIENVTVDEVLSVIRMEEDDDSHISVIAQQAKRIAELEGREDE